MERYQRTCHAGYAHHGSRRSLARAVPRMRKTTAGPCSAGRMHVGRAAPRGDHRPHRPFAPQLPVQDVGGVSPVPVVQMWGGRGAQAWASPAVAPQHAELARRHDLPLGSFVRGALWSHGHQTNPRHTSVYIYIYIYTHTYYTHTSHLHRNPLNHRPTLRRHPERPRAQTHRLARDHIAVVESALLGEPDLRRHAAMGWDGSQRPCSNQSAVAMQPFLSIVLPGATPVEISISEISTARDGRYQP